MQTSEQTTQSAPVTLPLYGGKQGVGVFRPITSVDAAEQHCNSGSHVWLRTRHGDARRVKITGAVRRWKRDRSRIEIPWKYDLYEYGTLDAGDIASGMLLRPI